MLRFSILIRAFVCSFPGCVNAGSIYTCTSKCYIICLFFFSDPLTTRISAYILIFLNFVHALSLSCKYLFRWPIFQFARLETMKRVCFYNSSHLLHLHINICDFTEIVKFLFICLISSFRSTVAPSKSVILFRFIHQFSVGASVAKPSVASVKISETLTMFQLRNMGY